MVENGMLLIVVTNSGKWVTAGHGETSGTGLTNLRRRLFLLLGEPAKLEVIEKPEEVRVEIKVPLVADPQSGLREHF
jgi:LytS/YehU family sensor histidine kinase